MFEYVSNAGSFSEVVSRTYFQSIIKALKHCFEHGVTHRDMKPENLLFDDQFVLKIADFGFATLVTFKNINSRFSPNIYFYITKIKLRMIIYIFKLEGK